MHPNALKLLARVFGILVEHAFAVQPLERRHQRGVRSAWKIHREVADLLGRVVHPDRGRALDLVLACDRCAGAGDGFVDALDAARAAEVNVVEFDRDVRKRGRGRVNGSMRVINGAARYLGDQLAACWIMYLKFRIVGGITPAAADEQPGAKIRVRRSTHVDHPSLISEAHSTSVRMNPAQELSFGETFEP